VLIGLVLIVLSCVTAVNLSDYRDKGEAREGVTLIMDGTF